MFRACARQYPGMHPSDVVQYLRIGEEMTLMQIAELLGVSKSTVSEWQRPEIQYIQTITVKALAASRKNVVRMNQVNAQHGHWGNHIWRNK